MKGKGWPSGAGGMLSELVGSQAGDNPPLSMVASTGLPACLHASLRLPPAELGDLEAAGQYYDKCIAAIHSEAQQGTSSSDA